MSWPNQIPTTGYPPSYPPGQHNPFTQTAQVGIQQNPFAAPNSDPFASLVQHLGVAPSLPPSHTSSSNPFTQNYAAGPAPAIPQHVQSFPANTQPVSLQQQQPPPSLPPRNNNPFQQFQSPQISPQLSPQLSPVLVHAQEPQSQELPIPSIQAPEKPPTLPQHQLQVGPPLLPRRSVGAHTPGAIPFPAPTNGTPAVSSSTYSESVSNLSVPTYSPPVPERSPITDNISVQVPTNGTGSPPMGAREDFAPNSSTFKSFFTVIATENYIIVKNNTDDDPLVIEKKGGHPNAFMPFREEEHGPEENHIGSVTIPADLILGIITLNVDEETDRKESWLILVTGKERVAEVEKKEIYKINRVRFLSFAPRSVWVTVGKGDQKPPYNDLEKFITSGLFYFSHDYNLTHSLQKQYEIPEEQKAKPMWKLADRRFFWNYYLQRFFIRKRMDKWIVPVIRGFAGMEKRNSIPNSTQTMDVVLISRISCLKAGTRYNARGVNDDGNVANFVESEQIVTIEDNVLSYVQTRGSVPVFWQQKFNKGQFKVELARSSDATMPAFAKHMEGMFKFYGNVHIVNLLESKKKEGEVASAYQEQLVKFKGLNKSSVAYTHWDFHAECGNSKFENIRNLFPLVNSDLERFGFFAKNSSKGVFHKQSGTFRVNCLDCLDRTNVIIGAIAQQCLPLQLDSIGIRGVYIGETSRLRDSLKNLWANNGDNLSKAYAGTGAMKSSFTRHGKRTVTGMMDDMAKSAMRMYINTFQDTNNQQDIDIFLGNIEEDIPESDQADDDRWVSRQLQMRKFQFSDVEKHKIFVASWNTNATVPSANLDLEQLHTPDFPNLRNAKHDEINIYIFGFQEIVQLSANSIYQADETNMNMWATLLREDINKRRSKSKITLAHCVQLVGLAILIFVSEPYLANIRHFIIEKAKVAAKGMAGNKGAVVCRFDFKDTMISCICAHLTAGQSQTQERQKDLENILQTKFPQTHHATTIDKHHYIFFFGDLNFRIDMERDASIKFIERGELGTLLKFDQLLRAKAEKRIFVDYTEGPITFKPTYKYDLGTDVYDRSDKKRVPAWCDRILYRASPGFNMSQLTYSRGELYTSDHRPVKALFEFEVLTYDHATRNKIERDLYKIAATLEREQLMNITMLHPLPDYPSVSTGNSGANSANSAPPRPSRTSNSAPTSGVNLSAPPAVSVRARSTTPTTSASTSTSSASFDDFDPRGGNYSAILGVAPTPPSNLSAAQMEFTKYSATLLLLRDKMAQAFGQQELIMSTTNLVAGSIRQILSMLAVLQTNSHALILTQILVEKVQIMASCAKNSVLNLSDKNQHTALVAIITDMKKALDDTIPKL